MLLSNRRGHVLLNPSKSPMTPRNRNDWMLNPCLLMPLKCLSSCFALQRWRVDNR